MSTITLGLWRNSAGFGPVPASWTANWFDPIISIFYTTVQPGIFHNLASDDPATLSSTNIFNSNAPIVSAFNAVFQAQTIGALGAPAFRLDWSNGNTALDIKLTTWNSIKNIEISSFGGNELVLTKWVDVKIGLASSQNDLTLTLLGSKRGFIETGDGNDIISIYAESNNWPDGNVFYVNSGSGDDTVKLTKSTQDYVPGIYKPEITQLIVDGGDGNDTLIGAYANDTLDGGAGNDTLIGMRGNDRIRGNDDDDVLIGDDILIVGYQDQDFAEDRFYEKFRRGNDDLGGGDGNDIIYGDAVTQVWGEGNFDSSNDRISGGSGSDIIYGDSLLLQSNSGGFAVGGRDLIYGDSGNDIIYGDAAADSYLTGAGNDRIFGGSGNDLISGDFAASIGFMSSGGGDDFINGEAGNDTIVGDLMGGLKVNDLEDVFDQYGLFAPQYDWLPFAFGMGADRLFGGSGDDVVVGDMRGRVSEWEIGSNAAERGTHLAFGDDEIAGDSGRDLLVGDWLIDSVLLTDRSTYRGPYENEPSLTPFLFGDDILRGGGGNDTLVGDLWVTDGAGVPIGGKVFGADTLDGGAGADLLVGGGGADKFMMRRGEIQGDVIADFEGAGATGGDIIEFVGFTGQPPLVNLGGSLWKIGNETFSLISSDGVGVSSLSAGDFIFT